LQQRVAVSGEEHAFHHIRVGTAHLRDGKRRFPGVEIVQRTTASIAGFDRQRNADLAPLLGDKLENLLVLRLGQGFVDG
jgi:hypothetical protein